MTILALALILAAPGMLQAEAGAAPPVQDPPAQDPPPKGEEAPPSIVGDESSSVWDYLRGKYDADRDGKISKAEYARGGLGWGRLDRNTDGVLSAEDFRGAGGRRGGGRGESRAAQMRQMRAEYAVSTYFQGDADGSQLTLHELKQSLAGLDSNADGKLDAEEFACCTAGKRWPGRGTPWEALTAQFDGDGDGQIELAALRDFAAARADENGIWKTPSRGNRRSGRVRGEPAGRPEGPQGAPVGELAPDFELAPPDGKKPVKLSSFRGKKPVALIFGSYT